MVTLSTVSIGTDLNLLGVEVLVLVCGKLSLPREVAIFIPLLPQPHVHIQSQRLAHQGVFLLDVRVFLVLVLVEALLIPVHPGVWLVSAAPIEAMVARHHGFQEE